MMKSWQAKICSPSNITRKIFSIFLKITIHIWHVAYNCFDYRYVLQCRLPRHDEHFLPTNLYFTKHVTNSIDLAMYYWLFQPSPCVYHLASVYVTANISFQLVDLPWAPKWSKATKVKFQEIWVFQKSLEIGHVWRQDFPLFKWQQIWSLFDLPWNWTHCLNAQVWQCFMWKKTYNQFMTILKQALRNCCLRFTPDRTSYSSELSVPWGWHRHSVALNWPQHHLYIGLLVINKGDFLRAFILE